MTRGIIIDIVAMLCVSLLAWQKIVPGGVAVSVITLAVAGRLSPPPAAPATPDAPPPEGPDAAAVKAKLGGIAALLLVVGRFVAHAARHGWHA